jgi:hypothetical protein
MADSFLEVPLQKKRAPVSGLFVIQSNLPAPLLAVRLVHGCPDILTPGRE